MCSVAGVINVRTYSRKTNKLQNVRTTERLHQEMENQLFQN